MGGMAVMDYCCYADQHIQHTAIDVLKVALIMKQCPALFDITSGHHKVELTFPSI